MKERFSRGTHRIVSPGAGQTFAPAVTPDALSEFDGLAARSWKSAEFEGIHKELKRFSERHTKLGEFTSADVENYKGYEILEPYLLILDVMPHPLDFTYSIVGPHVGEANGRPILGESINGLRARNMKKYGIYGHQAEMYCLFMDAYTQGDIFATSRNMTVCVDTSANRDRTKDIDIAAVRATTNGIFPNKIVAVALIAPTSTN